MSDNHGVFKEEGEGGKSKKKKSPLKRLSHWGYSEIDTPRHDRKCRPLRSGRGKKVFRGVAIFLKRGGGRSKGKKKLKTQNAL